MANPDYVLPRVTGPALVKVNLRTASTNVWTTLGYTAEGVTPVLQSFERDVFSDRFGGSEGAPVDKQRLGQIVRIPLQLMEYNLTALSVLNNMHNSTPNVDTNGVITPVTSGQITNIGCLQTQKGATVQVLIIGAKDDAELLVTPGAQTLTPLNFPNCHIAGEISLPIGAKNSVIDLEFIATPFTAWNTGAGGSGLSYLYVATQNVIPRLERYTGTP